MPFSTLIYFCLSVFASILVASSAHAFQDPSDVPAMQSALAARTPLIAVARAGERIMAVGNRGHIVYSDDGRVWTQAEVPVSNDLVALSFPTPRNGWAVGHDGVVLHSSDGGETWVKQLDGRQADEIAERYYAASGAPREYASFREKIEQLRSFSASRAFLAVYFENETSGFVVGTFNRIFRTMDGGTTWAPWMHRTGNTHELHFYSIQGDGRTIWMTGEQGMVWKLQQGADRFEAKPADYNGTLFGSVTVGSDLYVYGMRGSIFRSADGGDSWRRLEVPTQAGITGGVGFDDGRVLFVTQGLSVLSSADKGQTFHAMRMADPMSYFAVCRVDANRIAVTGVDGVRLEVLPHEASFAEGGAK